MASDAASMIVGIAGIVGTVSLGAIGLYFTARSRTSSNRQVLYTRQIDLAQKIFQTTGRITNLCVLLLPDSQHQVRARADLASLVVNLSTLSYEAAVIYPVELFAAFKRVNKELIKVIETFDEGNDITGPLDVFQAADTRWALMMRLLVGADELSIESLELHSKQSELERLRDIREDLIISHIVGTDSE